MSDIPHTAPAIGSAANVSERLDTLGDAVTKVGVHGLRITTAIVLGWIGAMKFTAYEAGAIEGLVASSPLTSWLYGVTSLQGASNLIGGIVGGVGQALAISAPITASGRAYNGQMEIETRYKVARAELKKQSRLSYERREKAGAVDWRITCRIDR